MILVVCGPAQSGKSVFINNLEKNLPSDSFITVRMNRDGEGAWTQNENQEQVMAVREKRPFDINFIYQKCEDVKRIKLPIVILDMGGKFTDDRVPIFKTCDSFIVLSNDENMKNLWKASGIENGCRCIACLDSVQESSDELYSCEDDCVEGRISNLYRSSDVHDSVVIRKIADIIVKNSDYTTKRISDGKTLDFTEIAIELDMCEVQENSNGQIYNNVNFDNNRAELIYDYLDTKIIEGQEEYNIWNCRANWVSAMTAKLCYAKNIKKIQVYDANCAEYVQLRLLEEKNIKENDILKYDLISSDTDVFIDIHLKKERLEIKDLADCFVPVLDYNKKLYISGKLPLWLLDSISLSLKNKRIYFMQPGKDFFCGWSSDLSELGKKSMPQVEKQKSK